MLTNFLVSINLSATLSLYTIPDNHTLDTTRSDCCKVLPAVSRSIMYLETTIIFGVTFYFSNFPPYLQQLSASTLAIDFHVIPKSRHDHPFCFRCVTKQIRSCVTSRNYLHLTRTKIMGFELLVSEMQSDRTGNRTRGLTWRSIIRYHQAIMALYDSEVQTR